MSRRMREIISRSTMALVAAALLFGAYKLMRLSWELDADPIAAASPGRRLTGAWLPLIIGLILALLGVVMGLAAVVPTELFARWFGRQNNTRLWDNPDTTGVTGWLDWW